MSRPEAFAAPGTPRRWWTAAPRRTQPWRTAALALALACAAWAGPNASATLHVDADAGTPAIEYSAPAAGPTFKVAVRIAGAKDLDGYAFEVGFEPARVDFLGAAPSGEGLANFLETRGGQSAAFVGKLSVRDSSRITVANSLAGADSARSPDGDGVLAVLEFRSKVPGLTRFFPGKVELLDWTQEPDSAQGFLGASVDVQDPVGVRIVTVSSMLRNAPRGSVDWKDILGRRTYRGAGLRLARAEPQAR